MNTGETTERGGRPPYEPTEEDLDLIEELASIGLRDRDIAGALGVSPGWLSVRKNDHETEVSKRIRKGRAIGRKERLKKQLQFTKSKDQQTAERANRFILKEIDNYSGVQRHEIEADVDHSGELNITYEVVEKRDTE